MRVQHRHILDGLYTPDNVTSLLIGTFPSVLIREAFHRIRQTDVDFFYGSADNNFWKDFSTIYKRPLSFVRTQAAIDERMALLNDLRLALTDIIVSCETTGGATDLALQDIELNKGILKTLDQYPDIKTLYFTSSSGKTNAESLTLKMFRDNKRISNMQIVQTGPRIRHFNFISTGKQRALTSITLFSPSPLAEQWGGVTPEKRLAQYSQYLPKLT